MQGQNTRERGSGLRAGGVKRAKRRENVDTGGGGGEGDSKASSNWRSSSMMRTEGFAVGSSWREGRERDRRGDNASSSIETRVLSLLSPRSLPLLEETGQVSRAREGKTLFASNSALSLPPLPLWTKEGKGSSEGNFFFFFCWVAREVGSFWKKVYSRTG